MDRSSISGLYAPGTTKSIAFRREGVVRVFCNIHPSMSAVIVVLQSPYFAVSAKNGNFQITGVPAGSYRLHVFHERATEQTLSACDAHRSSNAMGPCSLRRFRFPRAAIWSFRTRTNMERTIRPTSDSGGYLGTKP